MGIRSVLVVGGGIAGISAAYWLARLDPELDILLIEAEGQLAQHTTGRSAAQLIVNYGAPANRALTRASLGFFTEPPSDLVDGPLLSDRSMLTLGRPSHDPIIDATLADGAESGLETREVTVSEAAVTFPHVRSELFTRALVELDSADIDVAALHQGFLRGYRALGGSIATGKRVASAQHDGESWTVSAGDSSYRADVLVNAAGAWGDELAAAAGIDPVGLRPLRRTAFMVASPDPDSAPWPLVAEADHAWYVKPDGRQLLCSPADETPSEPCDARPEEIDVAIAIERINAATTLGIRSVASAWAGLRTFAPDDTIVIGPDPDQPTFFWCVGQGGTGIQSSPGAGRLVADLVVNSTVSEYFEGSGLVLADVLPNRLR